MVVLYHIPGTYRDDYFIHIKVFRTMPDPPLLDTGINRFRTKSLTEAYAGKM